MAGDAERGWRDYNGPLLAIYDRFVLGFMARVVWRTSTPRLLDNYRRFWGARLDDLESHLDSRTGRESVEEAK